MLTKLHFILNGFRNPGNCGCLCYVHLYLRRVERLPWELALQRLDLAAAYVGFQWPGSCHRAIHDCAATRAVWQYLMDRAGRSWSDTGRLGADGE